METEARKRARKKWLENNKEKYAEIHKKYRENNKDKIRQRYIDYRSKNLDKIRGIYQNLTPEQKKIRNKLQYDRAVASGYYKKYINSLESIFYQGMHTAKQRGLLWDITREQLKLLRCCYCYYCGGNLPTTRPGLDRIDNSKGYTFSNVLPCCFSCNTTRMNKYTVEEMKVMMNALAIYRKSV